MQKEGRKNINKNKTTAQELIIKKYRNEDKRGELDLCVLPADAILDKKNDKTIQKKDE